jgi:hypothetical protein
VTALLAPPAGRCALCGMAPHGGGYCGWGDYWTGDPFCRKCYRAGDVCRHTAAERAAFDRCPHDNVIALDDFASGRSARMCGDCGAVLP